MRQHLRCLVEVEVLIERRKKFQQIICRHPVTQIGAFRQIRYLCVRFRARQVSGDADFSGSRCQQAVCQLDECGFAAAIRPQQAHDAAALQRECDVVQCCFIAVAFAQPGAL